MYLSKMAVTVCMQYVVSIGLVLCKTTVFFRTCLHFNYLFQNIIRIFGVFEQNSRCGKPKKCAPIRIVTGLEFS